MRQNWRLGIHRGGEVSSPRWVGEPNPYAYSFGCSRSNFRVSRILVRPVAPLGVNAAELAARCPSWGRGFLAQMGWGTQPLRIQLRLLTFQFSCLPYPGATCRPSGVPPLWGFKTFVCRACYKHAAPLGLKQTPVGRDSYLDADMSILENRPTTGLIQTISSASSCVSAVSSITYHASRFISPETAASASP